MKRVQIPHLLEKKKKGEKAVLLTAYDAITAEIEDKAGIDVILVGDSVGMTVLGYRTTLPVTVDEMLIFCKAVRSRVKHALVIADMPFLSYQVSVEEAIRNAGRFLKEADCDGVKIEGGEEMLDVIKNLVRVGIPVMGHIGMTPQWIKAFGGYKVRGRTEKERQKLLRDAKLLEEAGVFSIILECVLPDIAKEISESLEIPVYGIGSGPYCDGQILVVTDILGLFKEFVPKYVKQYENLYDKIFAAVKRYIEDVKTGRYPSKEHCYDK